MAKLTFLSKLEFKYRRIVGLAFGIVLLSLIVWGSFNITVQPVRAFGGAVWFDNGAHYITNDDIKNRITQINAPADTKMKEAVSISTPLCESVETGFCKSNSYGADWYQYKTVVKPAVAYVAGTPDKQVLEGYCTLCNDGTFSPSCAVGRGACSYHSGVDAYNVPSYSTVYGTAPTPAQPAVYTYAPKSYQDSLLYSKPAEPSIDDIAKFSDKL